jgi:hypothetical protein
MHYVSLFHFDSRLCFAGWAREKRHWVLSTRSPREDYEHARRLRAEEFEQQSIVKGPAHFTDFPPLIS